MKKYFPTIIGWLTGAMVLLLGLLCDEPASEGLQVIRGEAAVIAAIIAAAVAATAYGTAATVNSIQAKKAHRAAERTLGGLNAENASSFYSDYYRGALENDSTRAYLKKLDSAMKKQNRTLDNSIVASGATTENKLAQKQAKNEVMSDAMATAVQAEDKQRQGIKNNYLTRKQNLTLSKLKSDQAYEAEKARSRVLAAQGVASAASSLAGIWGAGGAAAGGAAAAKAGADASTSSGAALGDYATLEGLEAKS